MVTVGTWNLENLFRPGADGPSETDEYDAKLDALAQTIVDLDPDVLAVQEVGDPAALDDLVDRLDGQWKTALAEPDGRGIRVGFIARDALTNVEQITDLPDRLNPVQVDDDGNTINQLGRPGLRVSVTTGGTTLDVVSAHLKSKLLTFPVAGSRPGTRMNAPGTPCTRCIVELPRPLDYASTSPNSCTVKAKTGRSSWPAI